jgi:hypothetical protein
LHHFIAHLSSLTFLTDEIHFNNACKHRYDVHLRFYTPTVIYALPYHRIPIPVPVSFAIYIPPAVPASSKLSSEIPYLNLPKCPHTSPFPSSITPAPHFKFTLTPSLPHRTARHPLCTSPMSDIYTLASCHCCTTHTYAGKCLIHYACLRIVAPKVPMSRRKYTCMLCICPGTMDTLCSVAASSGVVYAGMYEDVEIV